MLNIEFTQGSLDDKSQSELTAGLESHSQAQEAPTYDKQRVNWTVRDDNGELIAAVTADILWDWMYISELWVDDRCRGTGMGSKLMKNAEEYAIEHKLSGLWLWTQSWQAPAFYQKLGFVEFTRFDGFPKGHSRIGLRKVISGS